MQDEGLYLIGSAEQHMLFKDVALYHRAANVALQLDRFWQSNYGLSKLLGYLQSSFLKLYMAMNLNSENTGICCQCCHCCHLPKMVALMSRLSLQGPSL